MTARGGASLYSDVWPAAEDFVLAIAEHADIVWTPSDISDLAQSLVVRAVDVLHDPKKDFS